MITQYIPAPPFRDLFTIGPFTLHVYSLTMITAIAVAYIWSTRRVVKAGGDREAFESLGLIAVVAGIVGARLYHVITEHEKYFGPGLDPWNALKLWHGGLGVIGSIIGGGLAVWFVCRRKGIDTAAVADAIAPTLFVAQAIGRVGNYFNQEAFGKPTALPWGLQVDPQYRPSGYEQYDTFHPTFLYEGLWNLLGCSMLLWAERRFRLQHGKVIALYVIWYSFGRFFIELIRIDPVTTVLGVRINNWTDGIIFLAAAVIFGVLMRRFPTAVDAPLAGMGDKWHVNRVKVQPDQPEPAAEATGTDTLRHHEHPEAGDDDPGE